MFVRLELCVSHITQEEVWVWDGRMGGIEKKDKLHTRNKSMCSHYNSAASIGQLIDFCNISPSEKKERNKEAHSHCFDEESIIANNCSGPWTSTKGTVVPVYA